MKKTRGIKLRVVKPRKDRYRIKYWVDETDSEVAHWELSGDMTLINAVKIIKEKPLALLIDSDEV